MENLFEYCRDLDSLHFTSEQKAQMISNLEKSDMKKPHPIRKPASRIVLIAAVLALVLAIGGGALALRRAGDSFIPLFGTAQTEVIDKIGRPIDAGTTSDGIRITADAIIGDKYNACVVFSIMREDGSPFELPDGVSMKDLLFEHSDCDIRGSGGGHGSAWFMENTGDNTIHYVENYSADSELKLGQIKASFKKLQYFAPDGQIKTISDGTWNFRFEGNYEDSSISLPSGENFTQDGLNFKVTGISISPVAMKVDYETNGEADFGDRASADGREPEQMRRVEEQYLSSISIVLTKKDGSQLDLTNSGGGISPKNGKTVCSKSGVFSEIVPLEEMQSISIGGVEIPISSK